MGAGTSLLLCLLLSVFALTIWKAVKQTLLVPLKQDQHNTHWPAWWRWKNVCTLRCSYLAAITLYVMVSSWAQLVGAGASRQLGVPQAVGLLLAGMLVIAACWHAAMALIPALHEVLELYHPVFSTATFALLVAHCAWSQLMGGLRVGSFWEQVLLYVLFWLLDDTPPGTYMPQLFAACAMHTAVASGGSVSVLLMMRLKGVLASYVLLAWTSSKSLSPFSHKYIRPSELPCCLFRIMCAIATLTTALSLLLCTPPVVEPLIENPRLRTSWLAGLLATLVQAPAAGTRNRFGLSLNILAPVAMALMCMLATGLILFSVVEPPLKADPPHLAVMMEQNPTTYGLLVYLRSLPANKLCTVCLMLVVGQLQIAAMLYISAQLLLVLPWTSAAPAASVPHMTLLLVMLGVVLQVLGLAHLTIDAIPEQGSTTPTPGTSPLLLSPQHSSIPGVPEGHLASAFQNLTTPDEYNLSDELPMLPSMQDMELRLNALAKFKAFMQGLNQQADGYSIDEFIQGSKRAVHEVFPGVRHASFCLLDSMQTSCNIYNIVSEEEGLMRPPIIKMDIAPSTLIHHVLTTCQPVFIDNIAAVQGGPTDLAAMRLVLGLGSVACLPLMASTHVLGVLRLGYDVDREWEEQEQGLAKQLALILSYSTMDDGQQEGQDAAVDGLSTTDMQLLEGSLQGRGSDIVRAASQGVPSLQQSDMQDFKRNRAHSSHVDYSSADSHPQYQDADPEQWSHLPQHWRDQHLLLLQEQQLQQQHYQQQQQQHHHHQQQQQSPQHYYQLWGQQRDTGASESSAHLERAHMATFPTSRPQHPQEPDSSSTSSNFSTGSSSGINNTGPRRSHPTQGPPRMSHTFHVRALHPSQQGASRRSRGRARNGRTRLSQCTSSSSFINSPMNPAFVMDPFPSYNNLFTTRSNSAPHLTTYPFIDHPRRRVISLPTPSLSSRSSSHTNTRSAPLPPSRGNTKTHLSHDITTQSNPDAAPPPKHMHTSQQDLNGASPSPLQVNNFTQHSLEQGLHEAGSSAHHPLGPSHRLYQSPEPSDHLQQNMHQQRPLQDADSLLMMKSHPSQPQLPQPQHHGHQQQPPHQQAHPPPWALTGARYPQSREHPSQHSGAAPAPGIQRQQQQQQEQHEQQQQLHHLYQQHRQQLFPAGGAPSSREATFLSAASSLQQLQQQLPHHPKDIASMDRAELQWQLMQVQQQLAALQQQQLQQQQQQQQGWGEGPSHMVAMMYGPYPMIGGLSTVPSSPTHRFSPPSWGPAPWQQVGSTQRGGSNDGSVWGGVGGRDWQQAQLVMGMASRQPGGEGLSGQPPWAHTDFANGMATMSHGSTSSPNNPINDGSHRLWRRMDTISPPLFSTSNSLMSSMHAPTPPHELLHCPSSGPHTPTCTAHMPVSNSNLSLFSNYSNFQNQVPQPHMPSHMQGYPDQQWGSLEGWPNPCYSRSCDGTNAQQAPPRPSSEGVSSSTEIAMINANNPHTDVQLLGIIGRGGFGTVYKALWHDMLVAVKVLEHGDDFTGCTDDEKRREHDSCIDASGRRAALLEGAMTSTIKHPNVVQTYDYRVVHLNQEPPVQSGFLSPKRVVQETHIIMELCDMGSLQDAMKHNTFLLGDSVSATSERRNIRWQGQRCNMGEAKGKEEEPNHRHHSRTASLSVAGVAGEDVVTEEGEEAEEEDEDFPAVDLEALSMTLAEVAAAMAYLHAHRITHRDLKPKNILLRASDKDRRGFVAKVSDFGLSQVLPEGTRTQVSQRYSGTVTHMPPELIEDGKVYQQGDVYAFGIMMWELYTSSMPYPNMAHPQIMVAVVMHNLRPKFPSSCPEWFKSLAYKCWRKDPKLRPSFAEITAHLTLMMQNSAWGAAGDSRDNMERNLTQSLESDGLLQQQGAEAKRMRAEEQG